jgi:oligopeptide transport system substrate-binding protein
MRRAPGGHVVAAALAASALACSLPDSEYFGVVPEVTDPGHLRYCNQGEPEWLDPAMGSSTTSVKIMYALFDGLTDYDQNGLPMPSLASHWEVSDDLRRFTFHMHDRGRWSDGTPVTAYDVAYQAQRVLHPLTASNNTDLLEPLKNAAAYSANRVRVVMRDAGGLRAGDIVEIVAAAGRPHADYAAKNQSAPDSNLRRANRGFVLRDLGAPASEGYGSIRENSDVLIVELSGRPSSPPSPLGADGRPETWAYVHQNVGDGIYGWVPLAWLDIEPNAEVAYEVRPVPRKYVPGLDDTPEALAADAAANRPTTTIHGKDLLMLPEAFGLRVPDPYTVILETGDPTPYLLQVTPMRALRTTPRPAVSRWPRRWTDVEHIVTSGPLHLEEWKPRDRLELVRSPTFWNQDRIRTDRITVMSMDSQAASTNYYYTGGCDALVSNHIPASYIPVLNGEKRGRPFKDFRAEPYLGIYKVIVNTKRHPNRHFRRALAYAIDRAVIPAFLHGGQTPSSSFTPGTPIARLSDADLALCGVSRDTKGVAMIMVTGELCYVPPLGLEFDPDQARAELALARQEMGAAFPTTISYKYNVGNEGHKLIGEYLQAQWQKVLGLTVSVETQEWKVFLSDTRSGNFDTSRMGWIGNFPDPEGEFLPLFRCASPNNRAQWCDQRYEDAMEAARPIRDRVQRLEKIAEAEQVILDEAAIIPLYVYTQLHLRKPYVRDLAINLPDQPPLIEAWLDRDWRRHDPDPDPDEAEEAR